MDHDIVFKCPPTGMNVQHRLSCVSAHAAHAENTHVAVTCLACGSMHFVNSATGKLLADPSRPAQGRPR
jgi:RNase P subunit RPR2